MDTITAAQLIAELQTIPADTPVYLYIDGHRAGIHPFVDPLADGTADLKAQIDSY